MFQSAKRTDRRNEIIVDVKALCDFLKCLLSVSCRSKDAFSSPYSGHFKKYHIFCHIYEIAASPRRGKVLSFQEGLTYRDSSFKVTREDVRFFFVF